MRPQWFGDRAVLVPLDHGAQRHVVTRALAAALPDCSVRPGLETVLVEARFPDPGLLAVIASAVAVLDPPALSDASPTREVAIAVHYDGEDISEVAARLGCTASQVVRAHREQAWSVAMMGFAPGFAYLVADGPPLLPWGDLPRRDAPRSRVPAGSVAVAAGMSAVYPASMPGGWHLLGRSGARLFDPASHDPTLLRPGDAVRFIEAP